MKTDAKGNRVWILLFVDDMVCIGDEETDVVKFMNDLAERYEIKDLGISEKFLGMRVTYETDGIKMSLAFKTSELLERLNMAGCNPEKTPASESLSDDLFDAEMRRRDGEEEVITDFPVREAVGGILYLAMMVRPDICNAVRELSRYLEKPTRCVIKGIKRLLRYLAGTIDQGIKFLYDSHEGVEGYCDASYAGDRHGRKSVSGFIILVNGSPIDWKSQLQPCVAQSTMESEYMALAVMVNKLRVLRLIRAWFGYGDEDAYRVYEDNDACEVLAKGAGKGMRRAKHIDVRFHVVREAVKNGEIEIYHLATKEQIADTLTKNLGDSKFHYFVPRFTCQ